MSEKLTRLDLIKLYWLPDNPPTLHALARQLCVTPDWLYDQFKLHNVLCRSKNAFLNRARLEMMLWPSTEEYDCQV